MPLSPLAVVVTITLWASLVSLGAGTSTSTLVGAFRRPAVLRIVAFDALVVPPAAWLAVMAFDVPAGPAVGLLLVGAASAGPLGIVAARIARADVALALAAIAILELANVVVIPAWSAIMLPRSVTLPLAEIIVTVVVLIVVPVLVGHMIGRWLSHAVAGLNRILSPISIVGWIVAITIAFGTGWEALGSSLTPGLAAASLALMAVCLTGGWVVTADSPRSRASGALVTAQRGNIVALGIASTAFATVPEAALVVSVYAAVVSLIVPAAALAFRWRYGEAREPRSVQASA